MLGSIVAVALMGLKFGIDFTGGSLLEAGFTGVRPEISVLHETLKSAGFENVLIQPSGDKGIILRLRNIEESEHLNIINILRQSSGGDIVEKRFDSIGPTIGAELKQKSATALAMAIVGIVLYIAWAFRHVSKPVSSWKYGIVAIIALIHDVVIPIGVFAFLGRFAGIEIDTLFITALLTILGFSVHDTIVVFDRIRENLRTQKTGEAFELTVNRSMNETLARSINTSLTVLIVVAAIFFLGAATTKWFSLALGLGIIFGTYSSIFIASPLLVVWHGLKK